MMKEQPNSDCELLGISWPESQTCELEAVFRHPKGEVKTVRFEWVEDLSVQLKFSSFVWMTKEFSVKEKDGCKFVKILFGSDGYDCGAHERHDDDFVRMHLELSQHSGI